MAFMKLVWITGCLFLCVISGLLGLTAGINMNPESTVRFVPSWGSLGDWVSGTGALLAVLVTLHLADKQRREDTELLKVVANASFPFGPGYLGEPFISLALTSEGKRPVTATSLSVRSTQSKTGLAITGFANHSPIQNFPIRLEYGQQASIHLEPGAELEIENFVRDYCDGISKGLTFVVGTTTGYWEGPISSGLFEMRRNAADIRNSV
jgi:hypothetical protein